MARAKNRGYQQSFSPSYTIRRWRLGIYIRLSKEDLKKGKDDSNSVKNQRDPGERLRGIFSHVREYPPYTPKRTQGALPLDPAIASEQLEEVRCLPIALPIARRCRV